jgi:hypothetical protein
LDSNISGLSNISIYNELGCTLHSRLVFDLLLCSRAESDAAIRISHEARLSPSNNQNPRPNSKVQHLGVVCIVWVPSRGENDDKASNASDSSVVLIESSKKAGWMGDNTRCRPSSIVKNPVLSPIKQHRASLQRWCRVLLHFTFCIDKSSSLSRHSRYCPFLLPKRLLDCHHSTTL